MYHPHFVDSGKSSLSVGKVVCVGRNYAEHVKELNNSMPTEPLLFLKPPTAVVPLAPQFSLVTHLGDVHHELELALLVGKRLSRANEADCLDAIVGIGLALDLTLRTVQDRLKSKGQPWDIAKGFDGACPITDFVPVQGLPQDFHTTFSLLRNGKVQQSGDTADMLFPIGYLLATMSQYFTLEPGDIILTGTPSGVGPLAVGDRLRLQLGTTPAIETEVV